MIFVQSAQVLTNISTIYKSQISSGLDSVEKRAIRFIDDHNITRNSVPLSYRRAVVDLSVCYRYFHRLNQREKLGKMWLLISPLPSFAHVERPYLIVPLYQE